jgi:hypothetical protein
MECDRWPATGEGCQRALQEISEEILTVRDHQYNNIDCSFGKTRPLYRREWSSQASRDE